VVARISARIVLPLMPWQAYIHDVANEVDPVTGWWAYDEVVITVPRQAGKTTLKVPLYAHRLSTLPRGELWMTAQNGTKARDRWEKATDAMLRTPELVPHLKRWVSFSHERMLWKDTGALLRPFAPNDSNMHGESPDLVDVDEWWKFDAVAAKGLESAYSPGFLTKNAQAWKTSTMGTPASAGLNADVKKGRAAVEMDRRSGTAYFEWSIADAPFGVPIEDMADEDLIRACIEIHPAVGFHPVAPAEKMRHHIRKQLGDLGRQEFIRAYGNRMQDEAPGWQVISQPQWVAGMSDKAIPHGVPVGLGFEVDPDGRDAAIAVVWRGPDGRAVGEIVKTAEGTSWLPADVLALTGRWDVVQTAVQNAGPARNAADRVEALLRKVAELEDRKADELLRLSQMDFGAACARVHAEVTAKHPTLLHIGQPELNAAVEHVGKRRVGVLGSWAWRVNAAVSITPLVALTAALWAVDHPRETEPDIGPFRIR
jgi:hypothetical protein